MRGLGGVIIFKRPLVLMCFFMISGILAAFLGVAYVVLIPVIWLFFIILVWVAGNSRSLFVMRKFEIIILLLCFLLYGVGVYRNCTVTKIYEKYDRQLKMIQLETKDLSYKVDGKIIEIKKNSYGYTITLELKEGLVYVYADSKLNGLLTEDCDEKKMTDELFVAHLYGRNIIVFGEIIPMEYARNFGNYDEYKVLRSKGVLYKMSADNMYLSADEDGSNYCDISDVEKSDIDTSDVEISDIDTSDADTSGIATSDISGKLTVSGHIYKIKKYLRSILKEITPEKEYGILEAMVLGDNTELDKDIKELYSLSGISHIMAISGLHISLIGMGLYRILRKKMRYVSSATISLGIMSLFLVFIGNPISATRAVIMFFIHIFADLFGRKYDVLSGLSMAAIFILMENPYYLLNASFQLSFMAIIAVSVSAPVITNLFLGDGEEIEVRNVRGVEDSRGVKDSRGVEDSRGVGNVRAVGDVLTKFMHHIGLYIAKIFLFNVAVTISLMPLNAYLFCRHSTYSPLINMIVVPLVGLVLGMTLLGIFLAIFIPEIGAFCVGTGVYLLRFFTWLSEKIVMLPYANVITGKPSLMEVVLCYVLLVVVLLLARNVVKARKNTVGVRKDVAGVKEDILVNEEDILGNEQDILVNIEDILVVRKDVAGVKKDIVRVEKDIARTQGRLKENSKTIKISLKYVEIFLLLSIIVFIVFRNKFDRFSLCFLDVGQGACIYIRSESGNDYIIDGGSSDEKGVGEYIIEAFLEARGVEKLEYVFVTHCDTDHISGIVELIEGRNIVIDNLVLPDISIDARDEKYLKLVELAKMQEIEVLYMKGGDKLKDGEMIFRCLNPTGDISNINDSSLVFFMEYKELAAVFTGDIGKEVEKELLSDLKIMMIEGCDGKYEIGGDKNESSARGAGISNKGESNVRDEKLEGSVSTKRNRKYRFVVYDVAHHGSANSNSVEFVNLIKPNISVISCGRDNSYGHPAEEVLECLKDVGSEIWCTFVSGQIEIYEEEEGMKIKGFVDE